MQILLSTKDSSYVKSYELNNPTLNQFWKKIGEFCYEIAKQNLFPTVLNIQVENDSIYLKLGQRGTYVKNGITYPSMFVQLDNKSSSACLMYTLSRLPFSNEVFKESYLICCNEESNNYKFYHLKPDTSLGQLNCQYGRIGANDNEWGASRWVQTPYELWEYWIRYYEKLSKGYVDQTDVFLDTSTSDDTELKGAEAPKSSKINNDSLELFILLKKLAKQVVETNLKSIKITKKQVTTCKELLAQLNNIESVDEFNRILKQILVLSPRKIKEVNLLLASSQNDYLDIIERETNLLSAMEAMIGTNTDIKTISQQEDFSAYGITVKAATEKQKEFVMKYLNNSLQDKVDKVYAISPKHQKENFDKYVAENHITKYKHLWHGSKNENWWSIIVNSLKLNPNAQITGKMFGQGIYFAPKSTKSWNYTSYHGTYWANGTSSIGIMGLYKVAYGNPLDTDAPHNYSQNDLIQQGKNCVHAHAGNHLLNDEIVFYSEDALRLEYIVTFK